MVAKSRQAGRALAASVNKKIRKRRTAVAKDSGAAIIDIDTDSIVSAIAAISKNQVDVAPIVAALKGITQQNYERTDFSPIVSALKSIAPQAAKPLDLTPVVTALKAMEPKAIKPPNLNPLIQAIQGLSFKVDMTAVAKAIEGANKSTPTDISPIVKKIDALAMAVADNTATLNELINVVKAPKTVVYDKQGRIIEIKVNT